MNQLTSSLPPNSSAAVQAAVEQERRFGSIEGSVLALNLQHQHFLELYEVDKKAREFRDQELLATMKDTLAAANKTNGSVADVIQRMGAAEARMRDLAQDHEELGGGIQATQAQQAVFAVQQSSMGGEITSLKATAAAITQDVTALQKVSNDGAIASKAFWRTLGTEWKVIAFAVLASGALVSLAANITTISHWFN